MTLTWKDSIRKALKELDVEVYNPKRRKAKKKDDEKVGKKPGGEAEP